ncbi:Tetratricopeptide-like helical domain [Cinara cedri]|uniref:Tetratricopeptide-like helical domain n=1 Tax=Cinara cedri TaxID=506608 RepID=A0A5E4MMF7_9HEMI|nr:Tetratricopeptide-like helical domain [Cinara cedri]
MESEPIIYENEKSIELILFLDFIDNLECSLGFPLQFNVNVEFHDNTLNVGDLIVTVVDTTGKIDLEVPLNLTLDKISEYNNFDTHPMLINFELQSGQKPTNSNNATKKQTWVCVVDLLPLVYGGNEQRESMKAGDVRPWNAVAGRYPLKAVGELNRNVLSDTAARLFATVWWPDAAAAEAWLREFTPPNNVLSVTVHGLYNPPPSAAGRQQQQTASTTCTATLKVPVAIDADFNSVVFASGAYEDQPRDANDLRWYSLDNALATVSNTGQRYEEYYGPVVNSAKIPEPKDVLYKGPRFEWNVWWRSLMSDESSRKFQDFIFKHRYLPVSFAFNEDQSMANQKPKAGSNDDDGIVFVALLDLSMLLQPNCTSVRCLSIVHALDVETVKNNGVLLSLLVDFDTEESTERISKSFVSVKDGSQSSAVSHVTSYCGTLEPTATEWTLPFAVIDVSVDKSFYDQYVEHLTASMYALNVIPENPQRPPVTVNCTLPKSNKYRDCLKSIIEKLMNTSAEKINDPNGVEQYVNELKDAGTYDSLQLSLCDEIRLYIEENYDGLLIGDTVQSFVNRIFADLVDEMKETVASFEFPYSGGYGGNGGHVKSETAAIAYAREADELQDAERAKTFYLDLISTASTGYPNYWLLYASFCSRRLDFDTALECVKEVLLVDDGNRIGLFLYAAIRLTVHEDDDSGEIVLKSLVMSHEDFSEAYVLLGVYYTTLEMYEVSYVMLQRAASTAKADITDKNSFIHKNLLSWQPIGNNKDPLIKCAILLLELGLVKLATQCLQLVKNRCQQYYYYMAVCEYKNGNHSKSLIHLKNAKMTGNYKKIGNALKFLNYIELNGPPDVLEKVLSQVTDARTPPSDELHLVYLNCARYCYEHARYAKGAEICQIACAVVRTPMIFTLLAKCLIKIGEIEAAEVALNEANFMDVKNDEVWAYLTVVNVEMGNVDEAKVCYTKALECGLKPKMKKEIEILFRKNRYTPI